MVLERIIAEIETLIQEQESSASDQVLAKMEELSTYLDEHRIDIKEFANLIAPLMWRGVELLPYLMSIIRYPGENLYWYACLTLKHCAPHIFQTPALRSQLIEYIHDEAESVRGRVLGLIAQYAYGDDALVDVLISCWKDETNWIREVATIILREWAEASTDIFPKTADYLLTNLEEIEVGDPAVGNGAGDHATRLLFAIYTPRRFSLDTDFRTLIQTLKQMHLQQDCSTTCREKIVKIVTYFAQFVDVGAGPWDAAVEAIFHQLGLARTCWTCQHWRPQHVPLEELPLYLGSETYITFCDKHTRFFDDHQATELLAEGPLDCATGRFRPTFDMAYGLKLMGFCMERHELTYAGDTSEHYKQRPPERPIAHTLVLLDLDWAVDPPTLLWVRLDGLMRRLLDDWTAGANKYGQEFGGNIARAVELLTMVGMGARYASRKTYGELHFTEADIIRKDVWEVIDSTTTEILQFPDDTVFIMEGQEESLTSERTTQDLEFDLAPDWILCRDFTLLKQLGLYKKYDRI